VDFRQSLLIQHAIGHSRAVAATPFSFEDWVLDGLTAVQIRCRPRPGLHSLVWLLWHMARTEDVAINCLAADRPQVLEAEGWAARLGTGRRDIGTGMTDVEVAALSESLDVAAVRAYRAAVGRRTRAVVADLTPARLDALVPPERLERAAAEGLLGRRADAVTAGWRGRRVAYFLMAAAGNHNLYHLGEARVLRSLIDAAAPDRVRPAPVAVPA